MHVLLAPTSLISPADLLSLLANIFPLDAASPFGDPASESSAESSTSHPPTSSKSTPTLKEIAVPKYPPQSRAHADHLTTHYWPSIFTNTNPFGPHPAIYARAQTEIEADAGKHMAIARQLGADAEAAEHGVGVGAVVVERANGTASVVVGAGDGRWVGLRYDTPRAGERRGRGDPPGHAVMRAIALVARKRRDIAAREAGAASGEQADVADGKSIFVDRPLTGLESEILDLQNLMPGGYLCLNLEIYVTHEPCVMCSMAMVHSRFGKVVIATRMPMTGGIFGPVPITGDQENTGKEEQGNKENEEQENTERKALPTTGDAATHESSMQPSVLTPSTQMATEMETVSKLPDTCKLHALSQPHELSKHPNTGLGYGLFWREDLNWRFLAWQWLQKGTEYLPSEKRELSDDRTSTPTYA